MPEVFEFADQHNAQAVIKVIGVGGGGGNTVNQMVAGGIRGVDFICANTDAQHLERCNADVLVQMGNNVTRGLGAGADPSVGRQAAEQLGRIDCLVNNAAAMPVGEIETHEESTIDQMLEVNLRAPILFSKYATPHLRGAGGGAIIHMASVTGHNGFSGIAVYGATKGALIALARGQAIELANDNIRVNTVSPGTVDSPMLHRFIEENADDPVQARRDFDGIHPRGTVGSIEEVAAVFVFLASDEAANITAEDIRCDGGYAVQGTQPRG